MPEPKYILAILASGQSLIAMLEERDGKWVWVDPKLINIQPSPTKKGDIVTLFSVLTCAEGPNEMTPTGGLLYVTTPNEQIIEIYKKVREGVRLASAGLVAANSLPTLPS